MASSIGRWICSLIDANFLAKTQFQQIHAPAKTKFEVKYEKYREYREKL
jgi:hypothetical protein